MEQVEHHIHDYRDTNQNTGLVVGLVILLLVVMLLLFLGRSLFSSAPSTNVTVPDKIDVNLNQ